jgi:SAM-dependent methyltransferase
MNHDFTSVTELAGEEVTREQIERLAHRYHWAGELCGGKDVLEVGCGAGQGLGYLASLSKSLRAGDVTPYLVARAKAHYGSRIEILEMDAQALPFPDQSLDVVILFEAIYYLSSAERFVHECRRVLRPGGRVLVVTANKDLYDFNPSPFSLRYYGVPELRDLFSRRGFSCDFFGVTPVDSVSMRQRMLRPVKMLAAKFNLIPRTMAGKKYLKRLVFGKLVTMPAEVDRSIAPYTPPAPLPAGEPNHRYKVIYLAATLREKTDARPSAPE